MTEALATQSATRMIFLGNAALTDGFRLIGFEALTDPSVEQLERLLRQLQESRANAFIVVDHALAPITKSRSLPGPSPRLSI